ncbi:MAG: leucine-rich repeat domain-containing protein [Prevotella sp.]|nr:leucine-rich repeat domain-containing protein [Prevotella sp.]
MKFLMAAAMLAVSVAVSAQGGATTWLDASDHSKGFTDGILEYSTTFEHRPKGTVETLSGEVAVRLHLKDTKQCVDTVNSSYSSLSKESSYAYNNKKYTFKYNTYVTINGTRYGFYIEDIKSDVGRPYVGSQFKNEIITFKDYTITVDNGATKYEFVGFLSTALDETSQARRFWKRTRETVPYSTVSSVNIPASIADPDGNSYTVVAVQEYGFCWDEYDPLKMSYCDPNSTEPLTWYYPNNHMNDYLQSVTFPSTMRYIGDYAFMGCTKLNNVVIPNSVEHLGTDSYGGVFEHCTSLTNFQFQEEAKVTVIPKYTFWVCDNLTALDIPVGVQTIEECALQYNFKLANINLPSSLTTVGPHFLCLAMELTTLTVPASVTNIDGAFLHGCESLNTVYLLGKPADLQSNGVGLGDEIKPFASNSRGCAEDVSGATFYVRGNLLDDYTSNESWKIALEQDNKFEAMEITRTFKAGTWATVVFPNTEACSAFTKNYKQQFGEGTVVATMKSASRGVATGAIDPGNRLYSLTFEEIDVTDDLPTLTPLLIKPEKEIVVTLWNVQDLTDQSFMESRAVNRETRVTVDNDDDHAEIIFRGRMQPYKMFPWDFYLSNGKFKRVPSAAEGATAQDTRAWWRVQIDGVGSQISTSAVGNFVQPTAISSVDAGQNTVYDINIYDLNGRKMSVDKIDLPAGIYVINGKKVVVK